MLISYPACFYKEKEGGYSVIFPDLNHLATCADTLDEAFRMAIDCLAGYMYTAEKYNDKISEPSNLKDIDVNTEYDDYEEAFINVITVDVEEYAKKHFEKSVKKNVTIPKWLNDRALSEKINFSGVLQKALMEELHITHHHD